MDVVFVKKIRSSSSNHLCLLGSTPSIMNVVSLLCVSTRDLALPPFSPKTKCYLSRIFEILEALINMGPCCWPDYCTMTVYLQIITMTSPRRVFESIQPKKASSIRLSMFVIYRMLIRPFRSSKRHPFRKEVRYVITLESRRLLLRCSGPFQKIYNNFKSLLYLPLWEILVL